MRSLLLTVSDTGSFCFPGLGEGTETRTRMPPTNYKPLPGSAQGVAADGDTII